MSRRFSPQLLYALRNHIPITALIEDILGMPIRRVNGYFRFGCPDCDGFHTSVNPGKNLARCFDCRKNFNPIDMVMCRRKIGFTKSVQFLEKLLPWQSTKREEKPRATPGSGPSGHKTTGDNTSLYSLGEVLSRMVPAGKGDPDPAANPVHIRNIIRRLDTLEQKVAILLKFLSPE